MGIARNLKGRCATTLRRSIFIWIQTLNFSTSEQMFGLRGSEENRSTGSREGHDLTCYDRLSTPYSGALPEVTVRLAVSFLKR